MTKIRIGTRGSPLALKQAEEVAQKLQQHFSDIDTELVIIKTTGDSITDRNLADIGGKGLFTKELEESLLNKSIDIAVHSLKDMPADIEGVFNIDCVLEREDARDALITHNGNDIDSLPANAVIGSSSTRRSAQMLYHRKDFSIVPFRGNVQTRLKKLEDGVADATILAVAGLKRLDNTQVISHIFSPQEMLPAVGQGAICVQRCQDDETMANYLGPLHHEATAICVEAERAFLKTLEGNCKTPIAAHATLAGDLLTLEGLIAKEDGSDLVRSKVEGKLENATALGQSLAQSLKSKI